MKRRKEKKEPLIEGSGFAVHYKTFSSHLFECIKIAFETHVKFLDSQYRDQAFEALRDILQDVINPPKVEYRIHKETIQAAFFQRHWPSISSHIFRLDEVISNAKEFSAEIRNRSSEGSYASLVQMGCFVSGIFVIVALQSLPTLAIKVSNEVERYIESYGKNRIFVMDLRSSQKWIGYEDLDDQ
jgi:hypothetical protein